MPLDHKLIESQLEEARLALDGCFNLTRTSMYLGVGVVLVTSIGLYFREKRSSSVDQQ